VPAARWRSSASTGGPRCGSSADGTLDRPAAVTPDVHIFTRSKLDWIVLYDRTALWPPASLERLDAILGAG